MCSPIRVGVSINLFVKTGSVWELESVSSLTKQGRTLKGLPYLDLRYRTD